MPELAVVVVKADLVCEVIRACGRIGLKAAIVISSGFAEAGAEGRRLEQRVAQLAREAKIRLIGPNCLGVMAPAGKLNASLGGPLPAVGPPA